MIPVGHEEIMLDEEDDPNALTVVMPAPKLFQMARDNPGFMERLLNGTREVESALVVPADNERFTLKVNNNQNPIVVVIFNLISTGSGDEQWKYLGPKRTGKQVYEVRLWRPGRVQNVKEAREAADRLSCRLLEGQARKSFEAKYPVPDGQGPIIFGGSEWQSPSGDASVACLCKKRDDGRDEVWKSFFHYSGRDFGEDCRWPVVNK